jgi:hypothetical protein
VLYRRGTVILYKSENTKRPELRFRAVLSKSGTERLELARV